MRTVRQCNLLVATCPLRTWSRDVLRTTALPAQDMFKIFGSFPNDGARLCLIPLLLCLSMFTCMYTNRKQAKEREREGGGWRASRFPPVRFYLSKSCTIERGCVSACTYQLVLGGRPTARVGVFAPHSVVEEKEEEKETDFRQLHKTMHRQSMRIPLHTSRTRNKPASIVIANIKEHYKTCCSVAT